MVFENEFCDMLVGLGILVGRLYDHVWCQEAIVHQKGEHMFFVIRMVFRVHRGQKTIKLTKHDVMDTPKMRSVTLKLRISL